MSCLRTSKSVPLALLLVALWAGGCEDELPDPTMARVVLQFTPAGLARGAAVWVDETEVTDSLAVGAIDTLLSAGQHRIVVHPLCARVLPSETLSVEVLPGRDELLELRLVPSAGVISVTSTPSGLPIWLDGVPTGQSTPYDVTCLDEGVYEVAVRPTEEQKLGLLFTGDTMQTVPLTPDETKEIAFVFDREPLPQQRGVLLELLTATYCPNCPAAEEAAFELENDAQFEPEWLSTAELHLRWGDTDVFHNAEIQTRVVHYGNPGSAPIAYFNGTGRVIGSGGDILATYRGRILESYGTDARAALYWRNVRIEGSLLRGDLRFIAIEDLSTINELELHAFYTKDSLSARVLDGTIREFYAIVRDFLDEPIDLKAEGLTAPGSVLDTEIVFDLSTDNQWDSPSIRLAAFVQDQTTGAVLQCREVRLRIP